MININIFLLQTVLHHWHLPALHLHYEGLFNRDPATVDDHTLCVWQVPVVGVLKLNGVNHSLQKEIHRSRLDTLF